MDPVAPFRKAAVIAVLVHITMLCAVFDIYFYSPVEHGMTPHHTEGGVLAQRVVLFVADGLRATSLYDEHEIHAPYLKSIRENVGVWGIAHTQVPTESRPGHIALLAGFNEDPRAILKGWRSNPVDFDSVVNQSTNAWCWGSPDIVDMFNKDGLPHIHIDSYDAGMQDFSGKDNASTVLDLWVFDKVKKFVEEQPRSPFAYNDFRAEGNILFLHLLGLDTAGHSIKPTSKGYITNIKVVDDGIQSTVELLDEYFNDGRTAYVFTADHGMTNWGSHGDGSKHETEVPFIAWGAGINTHNKPININQTDIAPFLASLVGINIPINSLGVVPIDLLDALPSEKAHILYANSRQLTEQLLRKQGTFSKKGTRLMSKLVYPDSEPEALQRKLDRIHSDIQELNFDDAIATALQVIKLCKNLIKNYNTRHQLYLLGLVVTVFLGWIVHLVIMIIKASRFGKKLCIERFSITHIQTLKMFESIIYSTLPVVHLLVFVGVLPTDYLYTAMINNYYAIAINQHVLSLIFVFVWRSSTRTHLVEFIRYSLGIVLLVASFFDRSYMCIVPILYFWKSFYEMDLFKNFAEWRNHVIDLMLLAACPLFLELQTEFSYIYLMIAASLWVEFYFRFSRRKIPFIERCLFVGQFLLLAFAYLNVLMVNYTITNGYGLLTINQLMSWILLVVSPIIPTIFYKNLDTRILSSVLALAVPYTLMAIGFEHIFLGLFMRVIVKWSSTEKSRLQHANMNQRLTLYNTGDLRMIEYTFFLLMFVMFGYFGVGNTASMNSFDPMWVRCFVTIFSPHTMAGLILIKLTIPFLIVLCGFKNLVGRMMGSSHFSFLVLMFFCDLMVITLLCFVTNEGSWLQIGVSVSRFVTVNVAIIAIIVLYQIASWLMTFECVFLRQMCKKFLRTDA
uniref:GPI ethanolamine phosphate transferase 1 n=1 Tax=Photinus pyralis TaxID=7054 RepID=A0A1Y1L994_PHOPY